MLGFILVKLSMNINTLTKKNKKEKIKYDMNKKLEARLASEKYQYEKLIENATEKLKAKYLKKLERKLNKIRNSYERKTAVKIAKIVYDRELKKKDNIPKAKQEAYKAFQLWRRKSLADKD
jgi:asparagine synthetase B (glutamine-hydrolysing)